jgi:hypothetical protein
MFVAFSSYETTDQNSTINGSCNQNCMNLSTKNVLKIVPVLNCVMKTKFGNNVVTVL